MTNNELLRLEADIFNWCHGFEYDHERLLKLAEQAIQEKIEMRFDDNFFDEKVFFKSHDVFQLLMSLLSENHWGLAKYFCKISSLSKQQILIDALFGNDITGCQKYFLQNMFCYFDNWNLSGAIQQQHMINAIAHFLKINDFSDSVMNYVSEKVMKNSELMQQIRIALMNYGKSDGENSVLNLKYESVRYTDIDKNRMANYAKNIPENSSAYKFFVLQEFDKPAIIKKLQCFFGFLPEHHVIPAFKAIEMYTYVTQHKINVDGKIKEYSCQVAIFNPAQTVEKNINNINSVLCSAISNATGKNFRPISRLFAKSFQDVILPDTSWWHLLAHRQITPKTIEALNNYHRQNRGLVFMLDLFNPLILDEQINGFISEAGLKNRFTPQSLAFVENLKPDWYGLIKPEHVELFKGNENINIFYILREIGRKHPVEQGKTFKYHGYLNTFREYAYDILVWLLENKFPSNVIYWFFTKLLDCAVLQIKKEYKNQYFKDGRRIDFNKVLSCCFATPFPHKQKSDYEEHDGFVYQYEEFMLKWVKGRVSFLNQYWKCCSCLTRRKEEQKPEERKNIFGNDIAGLIEEYQQEVDMMFEFVQSEDDLAFAFHKMRHFF